MISIVLEQKLTAYTFYIKRVIKLPITEQANQQKWNTIVNSS